MKKERKSPQHKMPVNSGSARPDEQKEPDYQAPLFFMEEDDSGIGFGNGALVSGEMDERNER